MVGANYMGGKRNAARAKSKDVVGRAQRRHFGKQRLASALCATQENRVRPSLSTPSSVLPEIMLAHARYHASTDSAFSRNVFSGDRLYSSISSSNTTQRNKPSKVLGALDISDHMSMRGAIERILQQPNLVGISTTNHKGTAYTQTPASAGRPTDAHLDSKNSDTQHSEIGSKHIFNLQVACSQIQRHQSTSLPESNPNTSYGHTESGTFSPSDRSSRVWDITPQNAFDYAGYAEAQLFIGANCPEITEPEWPDTSLDGVHLLPRSSPFSSGSQTSDNSIIDLDTSPSASIRLGQLDDLPEEDVDYVDASSLRSDHQPTFRQSSWSFPIREGSAGLDEAQFTSPSLTNKEIEAEQSQTTCCNDGRTFPLIGNDDSRHSSPPGSGRNSIRNMTNQEVTGDEAPSDISIDFLSDPHPWETIGRILKLKPPGACAVQSVTINFTKDRVGVGYVSPEKLGTCNARSSDATSLGTRTDDTPVDDSHGASDTDPPFLDSEVSIVDNRMTIDTPDSPSTSNSTWPLPDAVPPFTAQAEVNPYIHVFPPQEAPSISVIHRTQNEHTRRSTPFSSVVGTTAAEPDIDMTFDGPCLFDDSDLEEDE